MSKKYKILVVLPFDGGSLPIGSYCAHALRDLNHTVEVFDSPSFLSTITALKNLRIRISRYEELEASFLQVVSQAIYEKAIEFEADLVLCLAQAPVTRQLLKRLKKDSITTAMWFVEDYTVFPYWRAFAPCYDFFFVLQKEPFLEELKSFGVTNALYLPVAALPSFHKPLELSAVEKKRFGSDVSFLGAGYPNRRQAFRQLLGFDFKIWGSEWDGAPALEHYIQSSSKRIPPEEAVIIFNATKININLHSTVKAHSLISHGDFINPRTFEIASCGGFQLVDERKFLSEFFSEEEMATFASIEELCDKIQYFLDNPEERIARALRARNKVISEHTYKHRMESLLNYIEMHTEGWPKKYQNTVLPDNLPDGLRDELSIMLAELKLPIDSSFEDVIGHVRQKTGILSPLETSMLFLDEWNKMYRPSC